jgi:hypothetical protein
VLGFPVESEVGVARRLTVTLDITALGFGLMSRSADAIGTAETGEIRLAKLSSAAQKAA